MSIENAADNNQPSADRAHREEWMRTIMAQPKSAVTAGEKLVGIALAWHMNMEASNPWHRAAWVKAGNLAPEVSMTEGSTTNALKSLWEKGWLKRVGKTDNGRGSWVYRFIYPEGVAPFGTQTPSANGVHSPMESTHQWSQTPSANGVRPHSPMESDPTGRLTESLNDPVNESMNHPINGDEDEIEEIKDKKPVDIKAAIQEFKDTYPKRAAVHILEKPFKEAMDQGATADQLIQAAKNYAEECKLTNKQMGFIKFPTNFLNEGMWENYLTTPKTRTSGPSLDEVLSWNVSSGYDHSHLSEDERPF